MDHKCWRDDLWGVEILVPAIEAIGVLKIDLVHEVPILHQNINHGILLKHADVISWQRLLEHLQSKQEAALVQDVNQGKADAVMSTSLLVQDGNKARRESSRNDEVEFEPFTNADLHASVNIERLHGNAACWPCFHC